MVPTTMLAAVYEPGNINLVLDKNYPIRELEDDEVLIKVLAAGVCHTDVAILSGVLLQQNKFVLGHEGCGVPVKLGSKVDKHVVHLGHRYAILGTGCIHGKPGGAPAINQFLGVGKDGFYAEYTIVPAALLVPVPEGVPSEVAAIATDAGVTAYHAVQHAANVKRGDKVLIFGAGGVGHLAVQYAKHFGATVYVCDFKPAARKLALELGATEAFDLIEMTNKTAAGFTVDTTIDFVANKQTFDLAMAALKGNEASFPTSPSLVIVGFSGENLVFDTLDVITAGVQIRTSTYGPRSALVTALKLFATGEVRGHVHSEPLENINKVIDELRAFEIVGRKVVIPKA
ncbi:alcohol dehydrogenase [Mycena venus]|uniref:Alcohol dehydrogenase n=1 Tax=Mycena venus TaxID=2733690 RepID=A0A8H6U076_9AGAR|nr:alcohol dehydrogenase [Mycena venus]